MLGRCPYSILQCTHPSTHLATHSPVHSSTHLSIFHPSIHSPTPPSIHHPPVFPSTLHSSIHHSSIFPSIHSSIHPSILLSIHLYIHPPILPPTIHHSIHYSTHLPTLSPTNPLIHTLSHCHPSIHSCPHSSAHFSIYLLASPPSTSPISPHSHFLTLSFIHMLHFKMANKMQSLSSESLCLSNDHSRPTGLLLCQCLPDPAAPPWPWFPSSPEQPASRKAFTMSLHLTVTSLSLPPLLFFRSGPGSGWEV